MTQLSLTARDLEHIWHPCTQMKDHQENIPMIPIKSGDGVWLYDYEDKRYLDAISSWWVNLFGHRNPKINQAIICQLEKLEHVILAGFSHQTAIDLAERLAKITPGALSKCFFADNGSSAVEIALKMSFQYWQNIGKKTKTRFINLSHSYHGETLGALSVGDVALYKKVFSPLLLEVITVPSPESYRKPEGVSLLEHTKTMFGQMEAMLAKHADTVAAVIVEPLVQCAGGMRMYHPHYLSLLREACNQYNVHLIADEIAVGFGRTGTLFACEHANITPDFMCLSKGITGGYLPLSVVMTDEATFEAFYDDYTKLNGFLHSHSYTGNPLACSAALATLDIFESENIIEQNQSLIRQLQESAECFKAHPHVAEVRQQGMILAVEMAKNVANREPYPWQERRGLTVYRHALSRGVILRPLGDVIYFMPPYVIRPEEVDLMIKVAYEGIEIAYAD